MGVLLGLAIIIVILIINWIISLFKKSKKETDKPSPFKIDFKEKIKRAASLGFPSKRPSK